MKTVYSFHPGTLAFLGAIELNDSDLDPNPPHEYLIPGGCVEVAPPTFDDQTQQAVWNGESWDLINLPDAEPEAPAPELSALKSIVVAHAKSQVLGFLSLLTSMQVDAMTDATLITLGDPPQTVPLAGVIKSLKNQLQTIPEGVDLSECTTLQEMQAVMQVAYLAVVAQAPEEIRDQFNAMIPG